MSAGALSLGLVGAGRTRSGLGRYLARFAEDAGGVVTALAGRTPERARANAAELADLLGHPVAACKSVAELCASGIGALVIASPPEHHLEALQAAAAAGLPTLCEKPLVHESQLAAGAAVLDQFAARAVPLWENCQWPLVLPALAELFPGTGPGAARTVALGLGPKGLGRSMVQDSLSHLLSLIQAVAHPGDATVERVRLDDPTLQAAGNVLRLHLRGATVRLDAELHLQHCPEPPRPAWLAIDGRRMDRRIGPGYSFSFAGNGREVQAEDPMLRLVAGFVECARSPDPAAAARELAALRRRLRWYGSVLAQIR